MNENRQCAGVRRPGWRVALALALMLAAGAAAGRAQPRLVPEEELQAAFILNFARYTAWPANAFTNAAAPLVFGAIGNDPVGQAMEKLLRDQRVGGRPVSFLRFEPGAPIGACHVLVLGEGARARLPELLESLRGRPVLTVGEFQPFATRGGMIGLVRREGRLQFEANPDAVTAAGLRLSSRLLQLATVVKTQPAPAP